VLVLVLVFLLDFVLALVTRPGRSRKHASCPHR